MGTLSRVVVSYGSERHPTDGVEHVGTGIGLPEERRTTRRFGSCARFGIVVRTDVDERGMTAFGHESPAEFDARHAAELDVEHEADGPTISSRVGCR